MKPQLKKGGSEVVDWTEPGKLPAGTKTKRRQKQKQKVNSLKIQTRLTVSWYNIQNVQDAIQNCSINEMSGKSQFIMEKGVKTAIMTMVQEVRLNIFETNSKIGIVSIDIKNILKGSNKNFITKIDINQHK